MNFTDITTDADYLLDVGMGPETHPQHWRNTGICHGNTDYPRVRDNTYIDSGNRAWILDCKSLGIGITDPARKWELLANVLQVIGPELDRRRWGYGIGNHFAHIWDRETGKEVRTYINNRNPEAHILTTILILEAYHAAVKAGETTDANQTD
jgi:hypothetical protein